MNRVHEGAMVLNGNRYGVLRWESNDGPYDIESSYQWVNEKMPDIRHGRSDGMRPCDFSYLLNFDLIDHIIIAPPHIEPKVGLREPNRKSYSTRLPDNLL